jgi:uncharacterized protein (TIGR03435 family)
MTMWSAHRFRSASNVLLGVALILAVESHAQQVASAPATLQARPQFDIADVHMSPRSAWAKTSANMMQGGFPIPGRYELRRATMLDLIRAAYAVDADKVYGGPSWLDYDRFDVIAKVPAGTRPDALKRMLQSLLAERFKLVVKMDKRPLPAYVLSKAKGGPKLSAADGKSDAFGCQSLPTTRTGEGAYSRIQCRNVTMEAFAAGLRRLSSNPTLGTLPVVGATELEGAWDIDLQFPAVVLRFSRASGSSVSNADGIFGAIEKLGLKLELSKAPQEVLVLEDVKEQPTANPPGVATSLPDLPSPEFEVATIRPCEVDGPGTTRPPRFEPGGRVTAMCMPLLALIEGVWNLGPQQKSVGGPKWLESDSRGGRYTITAKAPAGTFADASGNAPTQSRDALNAMMRALLIDRFKLAVHFEDRPVDAYSLVAVKPKLTKADPANRTGCTRETKAEGAGFSSRFVCQNITMAQFAEQLQGLDPVYISYPVLDATGLDGAWDFTISNNLVVAGLLGGRGGGAAAAPGELADPSGSLSFIDAIEKELGLKLEMRRRPAPVLVIDHIEEKPTEN